MLQFSSLSRDSSVVERSPEEAGVGGSIPSRGTKLELIEPETLRLDTILVSLMKPSYIVDIEAFNDFSLN